MTIKEFYEAAVKDGFDDFEIRIMYRDPFGFYDETDDDPVVMKVDWDKEYVVI